MCRYLHLQRTPASVIKREQSAEFPSFPRHPVIGYEAPQLGADALGVDHIDPRVGARVQTRQEYYYNVRCIWMGKVYGKNRKEQTQTVQTYKLCMDSQTRLMYYVTLVTFRIVLLSK